FMLAAGRDGAAQESGIVRFVSIMRSPATSPSATTAEMGLDVGFRVASTRPGTPLRSASSFAASGFFVATAFGTGRADVDKTTRAVCGAGTRIPAVVALPSPADLPAR